MRIQNLPHDYHQFIFDFIEEFGYSLDGYDGETYDIIITMEDENPELFTEYGEWLYNKIENHTLDVLDSEYPAWSFFDKDIQIVKNEWLIHFTEKGNAYDILKDGFRYGVDEIDKLGLTTHLSQINKEYGGFNFAYTIDDFIGYAKSSGFGNKYEYKYGNEAVLFQASGVRTWHFNDEEHQTIFYGSTAKNIIPITSGMDANWAVFNINGNILFENDDLEKVVNWVVNNFQQYRNVIITTHSMNEGNNKRISNHYFLKNLENAYHVFKNKELHYELFENLENSYDKLKNLNNVVIAYRVLNVDSENDINLDRLGKHFTTDYDSAISDDFLEKIGVIDYQGYYNYDRFYLITIETNINNVDIVKTIDNNINFPDEEEINFKNENEIKITSIKEIDI